MVGGVEPRAGGSGRVGWVARRGLSGGQRGDLDQVVGEDALSAPGSCAVDGDESGAVPSVGAFEVADASFAAGAPFHLEGSPVLDLAAGLAGFAFAGDGDVADAEVLEVFLDGGLAVAAVGGD